MLYFIARLFVFGLIAGGLAFLLADFVGLNSLKAVGISVAIVLATDEIINNSQNSKQDLIAILLTAILGGLGATLGVYLLA